MSKIFLVSDSHWNHANIIKYCGRPFANVKEMDKIMIRNWNEVVGVDDIVYHGGDFAFGDFRPYIEQLNGTIHLIKGNHDKKDDYHKYFASVNQYMEIKIPDSHLRICFQHFAMRVWNHSHFGNIHCYGHSHGTLPGLGRSMDVGVDTHDFYPYEMSEVVEKMMAISIKQIDASKPRDDIENKHKEDW